MSERTIRFPLRYKISRPILKAVFRFLFRMLGRVTITGWENIPARQTVCGGHEPRLHL